jgi:Tol biopolymer transport system component
MLDCFSGFRNQNPGKTLKKRLAAGFFLAMLGLVLLGCSLSAEPDQAILTVTLTPSPGITHSITLTATKTVTATATPVKILKTLVTGTPGKGTAQLRSATVRNPTATKPTATITRTPRRATLLVWTLTRQYILTLTRTPNTPTSKVTLTRTPTISPTWYQKIFPSPTLKKWPTFTRTITVYHTPTRSVTPTPNQTQTLERKILRETQTKTQSIRQSATASSKQTSQVVTQTAVAVNKIVAVDSSGTGGVKILLTANVDTSLMVNADWLPDGSGVVFEGDYPPNRQIYVLKPLDWYAEYILGQPVSDNIQPSWSPDLKWVAFSSIISGRRYVFVVSADGGSKYQLTSGTYYGYQPDWSPDGKQLVLISTQGGRTGVYTLDVSWLGSTPPDPMPALDGVPYLSGVTDKASPHYSPDGQMILFSAISDGYRHIFVIKNNWTMPLKLTDSSQYNDSEPDWSPDGKTVVFISNRGGNPDIYTVDASWLYTIDPPDPTVPQDPPPEPNLFYSSSENFSESSPHFSPDGTQILFVQKITP